GGRPAGGLDARAERFELEVRPLAGRVAPERGEERAVAGQLEELDGRDRAAPGRLLPPLEGAHDLASPRDALHARELDPLHVPDDGGPHGRSVASSWDGRDVWDGPAQAADELQSRRR